MPTALYAFPNILNVILTILSSLYFYHTFSKAKRRSHFLIVLISATLALSLVIWFISTKAIRFFLIIGVVFGLSFCFEMKMLHHVLLTSAFAALLGIADVAAYFSQMLILRLTSEQTLTEPYYSLGIINTFAILFLVLLIIHHARHRHFANTHNKQFFVLLALPIATLLAIWTEYIIARSFEITDSQKVLLLVNASVLIITNFIIFYYSDNIYDKLQYEYKLRIAEEMIEKQRQQYASLVESNSEIRQIKHDQKNFIIGALSELRQAEHEKLEAHLSDQLSHLDSFSYVASKWSIIDTVIEYKSQYADRFHAKINHDIRISAKPNVDDIDIAILIGNLLDNAIEAVSALSDDQSKNIEIFAESDERKTIISITNPVEKSIDTNHLKTTKNDANRHGYGLIAVKRIVDKYNGTLLLTCQDNVFEASAMLNQQK